MSGETYPCPHGFILGIACVYCQLENETWCKEHPRKVTMNWRSPSREILDQALHALWAGVSMALVLSPFPTAKGIGIGSLMVLVTREIEQWPPAKDRPWDPALDLAGYLLGVVIAVWCYRG